MSRTSLAIASLLLFLSESARAQPAGGAPYTFSQGTALNMMRPGAPGVCRVAPAPTAARPVQFDGQVAAGSSAGLACFGWGSILRIHCTADTKAAFVQSSTVTFGSAANPFALFDPEAAGGADPLVGAYAGPASQASFVQDGTWLHVIAAQAPWISPRAVTYRARSCDGGNGGSLGHPCNDDADCGAGGACAGATRAQCAFLVLEALTTAGTCYVCEER